VEFETVVRSRWSSVFQPTHPTLKHMDETITDQFPAPPSHFTDKTFLDNPPLISNALLTSINNPLSSKIAEIPPKIDLISKDELITTLDSIFSIATSLLSGTNLNNSSAQFLHLSAQIAQFQKLLRDLRHHQACEDFIELMDAKIADMKLLKDQMQGLLHQCRV
jgi:hypothetical protein